MGGISTARRGQPLWAIGGTLLCWVALRMVLFELPASGPALPIGAPSKMVGQGTSPRIGGAEIPEPTPTPAILQPPLLRPVAGTAAPTVELRPSIPLLPYHPLVRASLAPASTRRAAGHNLLWVAAMSALPLLPEVAAAVSGARNKLAPSDASPGPPQPRPRWSSDAWLAWRAGSQALAGAGTISPTYGGNQAGAVVRYDLGPGSRLRPAAYLRAVQALQGAREGDLAAGFAVRPLAGVPIAAQAEARLSRRGSRLALRPAAFLSGGIDDVPLAAGITARGYAQAGYVGGRDATAFADGSLIAEKPLWSSRSALLTAGGGAWGGAQRGAARLDLGPSASLRFRLGEGTARVSADYRLRIAGDSAPAAGAALTLSAGF